MPAKQSSAADVANEPAIDDDGGPSDVLSAPALAQRWQQADGCPAPSVDQPGPGGVQRTAATGCAGGTEVVLLGIDGGSHIWPSALDASAASAQFFATRP